MTNKPDFALKPRESASCRLVTLLLKRRLSADKVRLENGTNATAETADGAVNNGWNNGGPERHLPKKNGGSAARDFSHSPVNNGGNTAVPP